MAGHFIYQGVDNSGISKSIWLFIYSFHMPLFIFISGYFAKASIERRDKNKVIIFFFLYLILKIILFVIDKYIYKTNMTFTLLSEASIPWYLFAMGAWYLISMLTKNINKKRLFIVSMILAVIIGYDKSIRDMYCLSRIIVFYPFFLLGTMMGRNRIEELTNNKIIRCTSILFIAILICFYILFIDKIYCIRPLLTGRNSYYSLNDNLRDYGVLLRCIYYIFSGTIVIAFMNLIPKGKTFFSKAGSRTLTIYFLHAIVVRFFQREDIELEIYQSLTISLIVTSLCSLKWLSNPFNKIMKLNLNSKCNEIKQLNKKVLYLIEILMIIIIVFLIFHIVKGI